MGEQPSDSLAIRIPETRNKGLIVFLAVVFAVWAVVETVLISLLLQDDTFPAFPVARYFVLFGLFFLSLAGVAIIMAAARLIFPSEEIRCDEHKLTYRTYIFGVGTKEDACEVGDLRNLMLNPREWNEDTEYGPYFKVL